ncbi:MAG: membrane protein insertase YidC [Gammaproteobacteria bacterium]|nr:membrane protein insertase YidC [Gammaproteobacteria bacterium]
MHSIKLPVTIQSCKTGYFLVIFVLLLLTFFVGPELHADESVEYGGRENLLELETEATKKLRSEIALFSLEFKVDGSAFELQPEKMLVDDVSRSDKVEKISGYERNAAYEVRYTITKETNNAAIELKVELVSAVNIDTPVVNLRLHAGQIKESENQHGFASLYSYLKPILLNQEEQVDLDNETEIEDRACLNCWIGYRTQSAAYLVRDTSSETTTVTLEDGSIIKSLAIKPVITNQPGSQGEIHVASVFVYKGPVEFVTLSGTNEKSLMNMMYSHLWDWVRFIVFGVKTLAYFLFSLVGNWGFTIVFLAFSLRIIILPLSLMAERYQKEAIQNQQLLKPEIAKIKSKYKGEEQSIHLFKLYESHDIHPLSGFKGFLGLAIQLPILIAIFAFLSELQPINGVSFLWIKDLSLSDTLFTLPFVIPFFGDSFNLLPFIMLLISNLSSYIGIDPSLGSDALRSQRKNTFLLSLLFFVLFYSFPAAMVLYWTSSVLFELVQRNIFSKIVSSKETTGV